MYVHTLGALGNLGAVTDSEIRAFVQANLSDPDAIYQGVVSNHVTIEDIKRAMNYSTQDVTDYVKASRHYGLTALYNTWASAQGIIGYTDAGPIYGGQNASTITWSPAPASTPAVTAPAQVVTAPAQVVTSPAQVAPEPVTGSVFTVGPGSGSGPGPVASSAAQDRRLAFIKSEIDRVMNGGGSDEYKRQIIIDFLRNNNVSPAELVHATGYTMQEIIDFLTPKSTEATFGPTQSTPAGTASPFSIGPTAPAPVAQPVNPQITVTPVIPGTMNQQAFSPTAAPSPVPGATFGPTPGAPSDAVFSSGAGSITTGTGTIFDAGFPPIEPGAVQDAPASGGNYGALLAIAAFLLMGN